MELKFYGYKKCGTSRKAEKWLEEHKIDYDFIDITENPPSETTLKKIAAAAGVETKKLFNTSGEAYRSEKIKERLPELNDKEIFAMLAANGRLIKRPLICGANIATVGFHESTYAERYL